ncbi:hypothetical protein B0H14DRAFT_3422135 [Mycena olivaceomarginata]|nr:hypothetical protein B0H14DRAFT_3422135 [Mycena olivaceomarginata]
MSANRVLHHDEINRDSTILDVVQSRPAASENAGESLLPSGPASASQNTQGEELGVPPRREYVWRTMDRGQSLATIARRIALDLDTDLSSLRRMTWTDGRRPHRCAGYVREEITLATTTLDSAVVAHDAPSPSEFCPICHEVVGPQEKFWCACGDTTPGLRCTTKSGGRRSLQAASPPNPTPPNPAAAQQPPLQSQTPPQLTAASAQLIATINNYMKQNGVALPQRFLVQLAKLSPAERQQTMLKMIQTGQEHTVRFRPSIRPL